MYINTVLQLTAMDPEAFCFVSVDYRTPPAQLRDLTARLDQELLVVWEIVCCVEYCFVQR